MQSGCVSFPSGWGCAPRDPAAIPGWVEDNLVAGIKRSRAGEHVAWLNAQLRSPGSPHAARLELQVRQRVQDQHHRRRLLLDLRRQPPAA